MADDWDDWEDDAPAAPAPAAAGASEEPAAAVGAQEDGWGWDLEALEANVRQLEAARSGVDAAASAALLGGGALEGEEEDARKLRGLAGAAPAALQALQQGRRRAAALAELAKVTRLHLLAARLGFVGVAGSGEGMEELKAEMERVDAELRETAGDWATSISAWSKEDGHKLEEMASALHQSLHASGEDQDLSLFQQVVEQVFDALPDHSLRVSVEWIHPSAPKSKNSKRSSRRKARADVSPYLTQLIGMAADGENSPTHSRPTRIPVLTDAQIFQDAKDIARDEMTVNGDLVAGSIGYDAIVDRIQTQLEHLLAVEIGKPPQLMSMQLSDTLMRISMEILNASNRTESGGSAYEVLGRFLTNHEMDHVLIRPASAKAPPIQIDMNMGAYVACATEANTSDWCFGVRVTLTAVTWYLVCDAADPTVELYEVKSTYRNRLAFPVGLTPFHPLNHMRKDHGAVDLKLMAPATITSDVLIGEELKSDAQPSIAFDELL